MLKELLLRKKLEALQAELAPYTAKREELKKKEEELTRAVEEVTEETSDEDKKVVEDAVNDHEREAGETEQKIEELEEKIKAIEDELDALKKDKDEALQDTETDEVEEKDTARAVQVEPEKRGYDIMEKMNLREAVKTEEVRSFLGEVRGAFEGRAVNNISLAVPQNLVAVIHEQVEKYSKLISYVDRRSVHGKGREIIVGKYPEAVWIETCTYLNEIGLDLYDVEVDGYTVGGFIPVCRAALSDTDIGLANEVTTAIAQAIGYAIDKAILYGTGKKMPRGIVTRLAEKAKPEYWIDSNPAWADLSTTNVKQVKGDGIELFKNLAKDLKLTKTSLSGEKVWVMSEATKNILTSQALSFNASGALVSGIANAMPVLGGNIVTLDFVPDGDIIVGYFKNYLLAEREGVVLESSDDVEFYRHKRVYKGLARYDGTPVFGGAFAALNILGKAPTTAVEFAPDKANAAGKANTGANPATV